MNCGLAPIQPLSAPTSLPVLTIILGGQNTPTSGNYTDTLVINVAF
ncbi:MAG: hypothetical protein AB8W37_12135 [Arsenophonus endosymbiont of Dermacentor nuttalli]